MPAEALLPETRCPECGYIHGDAAAPSGLLPPAMQRARRRIPRCITLIAVLAFAGYLVITARAAPLVTGPVMPMYAEPLISYADLVAIARGEPVAGPGLLTRLQRSLAPIPRPDPGRRLIEARFDDAFPQATVPERRTRTYGWPAPWLTIHTFRTYENPILRTGLKKAVTDSTAVAPPATRTQMPFLDALRIPRNPRFAWFGDVIRYQPPPEETDGIPTVYSFLLSAILSSMGVLVAIWWAASLAARLLKRRARLARIIPALITAAGAITMLAAGIGGAQPLPTPHLHGSGFMPSPTHASPREGFTRLSIDQDAFLALTSPPGDRTLAQLILDEVPQPPGPPESSFLVIVCDPESQISSGSSLTLSTGYRLFTLTRASYARRPGVPGDSPLQRRAVAPIRYSARLLSISYSPAGDPPVAYAAHADVPRLAVVVAFIWLLHRLVRWMIMLIQRAQLRSRARHRLCPVCRYPLPITSPS